MLMVVVMNKAEPLQPLLLRESAGKIPGSVQIGNCGPECHPLIVTCSQRDYRLAVDEAFKSHSGIDHDDSVRCGDKTVDIFVQQKDVWAGGGPLPRFLLKIRRHDAGMQFENDIAA